MTRGRRFRRWVVRPILAVALVVAVFMGARLARSNFGTVAPGRIYRSGQMTARTLSEAVRSHRVRTVLNLRGSNPDQTWYRAERSATIAAGATQIDVPMASDHWLSRDQARALILILDSCEYPLLIHCQWGAERTGLVSAFTELLRPGGTLASARRQFSVYYMFLPVRDGKVMAAHLDEYAKWLHSRNLLHSPSHFREYISTGYIPRLPSREYWPYDPDPLFISSRTGLTAKTQRTPR